MIHRPYLTSILALVLVSPLSLAAQEYVVGPAAFEIQGAQENCESIGRTLAGFDEHSDIDTIIELCQGTSSSNLSFCFTRYVVNETQDGHVSILDGTPMPDASEYFEGPPVYPMDQYVMARTTTSFLIENRNVGWPICQWPEPPLFADGFESGDTGQWSSTRLASPTQPAIAP